ncbi:hypothetical protein HanIR_Chr08g0344161 [Helianthus annuus]|nr:hypothetical protein HanIR_Chr08g0344161 [Helianthus annuus]
MASCPFFLCLHLMSCVSLYACTAPCVNDMASWSLYLCYPGFAYEGVDHGRCPWDTTPCLLSASVCLFLSGILSVARPHALVARPRVCLLNCCF